MVRAGFDPVLALQATIVCQTFVYGMIGLQAQLERAQQSTRKDDPRVARAEKVDARKLLELGMDSLTEGFRSWLPTTPESAAPRRRKRRRTLA